MLSEQSCPFALWLNSPHIWRLLSPRSKPVAHLNTDLNTKSTHFLLLKSGLSTCAVFWLKTQGAHRFSPMRFNLILHISFILICVKWKQTSLAQEQTHHRWTYIYIVCKQRLSFLRHGKWGAQTQHYRSSSQVWPWVSGLLSLMSRKSTHALCRCVCSTQKDVVCLQGIFFSKGYVSCSGLDLLNEV